jgi:hypothetical protein
MAHAPPPLPVDFFTEERNPFRAKQFRSGRHGLARNMPLQFTVLGE